MRETLAALGIEGPADAPGAFVPADAPGALVLAGAPGRAIVPLSASRTGGTAVGETAVAGHHNTVNQMTTKMNININVFGGEMTDHITPAKVFELIQDTPEVASPVDAALQVLAKAAMLIYSDANHPENVTCYVPNKKNPEALVHGDTGWEIQPVQLVLPAMTQATTRVLTKNQPLPGLEGCDQMREYTEHGELFAALVRNREVFEKGQGQMKTILVRNKALLERALESLPVAGGK